MIVWATCFPVPTQECADGIFNICIRTLSESPNHPWQPTDFPSPPINSIINFTKENQVVEFAHFERSGQLWRGVRHIHPSESDGEVWETTVVCHSTVKKSIVSIRLDRTSVTPKTLTSDPKTPYIVRNILDAHAGALDGAFAVQKKPHMLGEGDVNLAARVMRGEANCSLPIVYLSTAYNHLPVLNADKLAAWLGGMAHVVVEPSRHFSRAVAREVSFTNPHLGTVAVFWPYATSRAARCNPDDFASSVKMATHITHIVRDALTVGRQPPEASWGAIASEIHRANFEKIRSSDTSNAKALIAGFDDELNSVLERAESAEREVERLRRELQRSTAQAASTENGILKQGVEQPYYTGELEHALVYALEKSLSLLSPKGRVHDIIQSVVEANKLKENNHDLESKLDEMIPDTQLNGQDKKALEKLGFIITEEGKHIKLVFQDDERYTFTAAKTPSDFRSMKNFKALVIRQLCR